MGDLCHYIPVTVEPEARAYVFMEEQAATKGWAVVVAVEVTCMDDAAEARLCKQFIRKIGCPRKAGEDLTCRS
jgi:hypothetical protein